MAPLTKERLFRCVAGWPGRQTSVETLGSQTL